MNENDNLNLESFGISKKQLESISKDKYVLQMKSHICLDKKFISLMHNSQQNFIIAFSNSSVIPYECNPDPLIVLILKVFSSTNEIFSVLMNEYLKRSDDNEPITNLHSSIRFMILFYWVYRFDKKSIFKDSDHFDENKCLNVLDLRSIENDIKSLEMKYNEKVLQFSEYINVSDKLSCENECLSLHKSISKVYRESIIKLLKMPKEFVEMVKYSIDLDINLNSQESKLLLIVMSKKTLEQNTYCETDDYVTKTCFRFLTDPNIINRGKTYDRYITSKIDYLDTYMYFHKIQFVNNRKIKCLPEYLKF